jgi:hypothetical protein
MAARPHDPDGEPDDAARDEEQGTAREPDVDGEWLAIVARLRGDGGTGTDAADVDGAADDAPRSGDLPAPPGATPPAVTPAPGAGTPPGATAPSDPRSWSVDPALEEQETHFQPPDPGPVLGGDPLLTMAWSAVGLAPLLFLLSLTVWPSAPRILLQVASALFVAGLGVLLWRMPHRRDDDAGPGAVV